MFPAVESPILASLAATLFGWRDWLVGSSSLHHVYNGIYVGNIAAAQDLELLREHNITNVVAATQFGEAARFFPHDLSYHIVNINDLPEEPIGATLDGAVEYIRNALRAPGNKVLIHCNAGRSRSVTIMAAYLLAETQDFPTALAAIDWIRVRRPEANPNEGFVAQLTGWLIQLPERGTHRTEAK